MLRIDPGPLAPATTPAPQGRRSGGPGARTGSYVGQRAFTSTADTVRLFAWDGERWVSRGCWRIPGRQA